VYREESNMIELDHPFSVDKPSDQTWDLILDLDRVIPCVEGGRVIERTAPDSAKAEITVKMGAMSMKFTGTVTVAERDDDARRAVLQVKSREAQGQGYANADVTVNVADAGGTIHTAAQITGKAASMGEGVMVSVLDALIKDFAGKLATA
jgi:carbon monoxide dehydrogenase subunit G